MVVGWVPLALWARVDLAAAAAGLAASVAMVVLVRRPVAFPLRQHRQTASAGREEGLRQRALRQGSPNTAAVAVVAHRRSRHAPTVADRCMALAAVVPVVVSGLATSKSTVAQAVAPMRMQTLAAVRRQVVARMAAMGLMERPSIVAKAAVAVVATLPARLASAAAAARLAAVAVVVAAERLSAATAGAGRAVRSGSTLGDLSGRAGGF